MLAVVDETIMTDLWKKYKENPNLELRNELVLKYASIVKSIVRRVGSISGSYADAEDLTSYGMIGLIKAVEKYDIDKGVTFETFATYRIRGEIIDYMRRNDWVPRGVRKRAGMFENVSMELQSSLGRRPTDSELCQKLNIKTSDFAKMLSEIERFNVVSLEELIQDTIRIKENYNGDDTPEGKLSENEMFDVLTQSVESLPEREHLVITLYYYEELTLKEISRIIGVSESRVSQLHSRAIGKLKQSLKPYMEI